MDNFIINQVMLYLSIAVILFAPGYFLSLAIFGKKKLGVLEKFVVSFGLSIAATDVILIFLDKFKFSITAFSILVAIFLIAVISSVIFFLRNKKESDDLEVEKNIYSKKQTFLIVAIILFSFLIRAFFLSGTIVPTGTDLGHHMFWTKKIVESGSLPVYEKFNIIKTDGNYSVSEPEKIDDFIVGEHLIFASLALVSKNDPVSAFPSLVLLLINIMGMLSLYILSLRLFHRSANKINISITVLFLTGTLFALSGSQGNFVSGGVIGNLLGNFFIPLIFYFLFRALSEKDSTFFSLSIVTSFILAYTHHLSALVFSFSLLLILILILIFKAKDFLIEIKKWLKLLFSPQALTVILAIVAFIVFVKIPGYIENQAVKTVIGDPSRSTKEGLSFSQIFSITGESRAIIGIVGIILLIFLIKKFKYRSAFILGWFFSIFIMAWKPTLLHIDIPSSRIGNYLALPLILAGAFMLNWLFFEFLSKSKENKTFLTKNQLLVVFLVLLLYISMEGFLSNAHSISPGEKDSKFIETFAIASYLSEKIEANDLVVKDHNYVSADSWMKVFFLKDYNYPLTRSFYFRYDSPQREKCTLWTISEPKSSNAQKCFNEAGINFIVINPAYDSVQFNDSEEFWKVYSADLVESYYRKK